MPAADRSAADKLAETFRQTDADGDRFLTIEEHRTLPGDPRVHDRDFRLFDFDGDGRLSRDEFAAIPGRLPVAERGPLPDPFDDLLAAAIAAMDEAHNGWDRRPDAAIPAQDFAIAFHASTNPVAREPLNQNLLAWADRDRDGRITRDEARRFLMMQLGLTTTTEKPLREPSGRVVNWGRYLELDANKNSSLDREELLAAKDAAQVENELAEHDLDGNGLISIGEYGSWFGAADPIEFFRAADTNLDARLDPQELRQAVAEPFAKLIAPMFTACDDDRDGALSLLEYRLSMFGNPIWTWETPLIDRTGDGFLNFNEFDFGKRRFMLLLRFYFHRLDADGDNLLSPAEFPFNPRPAQENPAPARGRAVPLFLPL